VQAIRPSLDSLAAGRRNGQYRDFDRLAFGKTVTDINEWFVTQKSGISTNNLCVGIFAFELTIEKLWIKIYVVIQEILLIISLNSKRSYIC